MKPAAVSLLGHVENAGGESTKLRAQLLRKEDSHLRHVDLEELVKPGWNVDGDSGQLAVLVHRPEAVPASALNHAVTAVDVNPLLPVPLFWSTSRGMGLHARKLHLARQHVGPYI